MKSKIIIGLVIFFLISSYTRIFAGGWELLQNSPTTNDLHSVYFLDDNTGWIAGDNSTIYKTTNSGESWVQQTSPETSKFQCITFVSADTGWACGTGGTVIKTTNGGANWFSQTFTASKFNSMDFINSNTGFIAGDFGNIYKTINGGITWTPQVSGVNQSLHQINIRGGQTVIAVGDNAIILRTTNYGVEWITQSGPGIVSQIFYTLTGFPIISIGTLTKYSADGGVSWNLSEFPTEPIYSLTEMEDNKCLGVGGNGYIVYAIFNQDSGVHFTQEPSPTTQNLYSVHYPKLSNFIWAVGANGTILKTTLNWTRVSLVPLPYCSFNSVYFTDSNTGYGVSCGIFKTTDSGITWTQQTWGGSATLRSVYFTDASTGYIVGASGTILKTTNSGTNWDTLSSGTTQSLNSVYFTDANTGYIAAGNGQILKTTNGGTDWTSQYYPYYDFYSIYFSDANTGYIAGEYGRILKTTDAGITWTGQGGFPSDFTFNSVYFLDVNTGFIVGNYGNIFKTVNGGINWTSKGGFPSDFTFNSVYFLDENLGYLCSSSTIYKTTNGGDSWVIDEIQSGTVYPWLQDIKFVIENNTAFGFAVGDVIFRTSFEYFGAEPGGNSGSYPGWVPVNSGTSTGSINGADYINPFVAFVVGDDPSGTERGLILRTINGGQTWTRQQSNATTSYLWDVSFADINNGMAVGINGFVSGIIRKTTNGGADWIEQTSAPLYSLYSVDMLDANNAFACGFQGLMLHTSDGGTNWQTQSTGILGVSWNSIDYINQTTATAVGSPGKIIRTTDTGLNWIEQTGGGNHDLRGVKFIDVDNGIAIAYEGPVLRTTNGGTNWVQTDSLTGIPKDVSFIDPDNAFIVTSDGTVSYIYHSTDGGLSWILQDTRAENLAAVSFTDASNGVITGSQGMILRTSNGGVNNGTNTAYKRNGLNLPIGDFQNTDDSINVNITYNPSAFSVTRVYVTIDTVLHTNDGDLEFYLEHNGIIDTLIYQNGEGGENFLGTFLNDETNFPLVSGAAPFRGSFQPYRPLSKFYGQDPDGYWKLRIYDRASGNTGTLDAWSLTVLYQTLTDVENYHQIPSEYMLSQNYPNPFNPSTTIRYGLTQQMLVTLKIYNILGQEVATLVNEEKPAGSYQVNWNASNLSSGIYFYRLHAGSFVETKKMILLK